MNAVQQIGQKVARLSGTLLFFATIHLLFAMPASAATYAVVGNGTPASCTQETLQTAVAEGGEVTFNCGAAPHTILFSSIINLNVDVVIDGGGLITLNGNNGSPIFNIAAANTVTLRGLSIINAPNSASAIFNSGTLTVEDSSFQDNLRGAIYNSGGTITVVDSTFEGNVTSSGGAITNEGGGTLSISGSTFRNNSITGSNWGGAVFGSTNSTTTIVDSLFEDNKALNGTGGAIYNSHVMTIEHSIIRNNTANGGGGIYNHGTLTVIDTHISGNETTGTGGGGIAHFNNSQTPSKLTLIRSTVERNTSQQGGGGILFVGESATMEAINSTIYSNTATTIGGGGLLIQDGVATLTNVTISDNNSLATDGEDVENSSTHPGTVTLENTLVVGGGCAGTITDGDGNLEFPGATCGFDTPSADPGLGAPASNGGWTPTIAITEGGPAQNAAVNNNCPATDQRGVLRPQFTTCDIGAFEWGALPVLTSIAPTSTIALSPTFTLAVFGSNFIPGSPASRVLWNGEALPTTYVSGTELRATVDANRIQAGGQVSVTVQTPVVDGGVSQFTAIFTIFKRDQTINFAELQDRTADPETFDLIANATSGLPVSFSAAGVCTVAGNTVTLTGELGKCTITAQQAGNESYNAAPNIVRSFDVIEPREGVLHIPHIFGNEAIQ